MQFNKNKLEPFHRWYPFVEGYSKEFIQSIILELDPNLFYMKGTFHFYINY